MSSIFHTIISKPLYNGLIALVGLLPFFDAGIIIIIFTIVVKIIMLPLSIKASKAQLQMKSIEKDLQQIKEKHKDSKEEQTKKTMEYYKENNINPFSGLIILIIQLPLLIGLYQVFLKSGLPNIDSTLLYSFISSPVPPNMMFLGLIDIAEKSLFLAVIAGVTSYFQISFSTPQSSPGDTQSDIAKAMSMQMKYFFPILMAFIAYTISSAVALYLITSNVFAIGQEIYIRKKYHKSAIVM
ncbi:MAG: YidC/Oxa1 family membrane protein insertase [Minisyncoccia bacterium]